MEGTSGFGFVSQNQRCRSTRGGLSAGFFLLVLHDVIAIRLQRCVDLPGSRYLMTPLTDDGQTSLPDDGQTNAFTFTLASLINLAMSRF